MGVRELEQKPVVDYFVKHAFDFSFWKIEQGLELSFWEVE
jgi:hypothetical protein